MLASQEYHQEHHQEHHQEINNHHQEINNHHQYQNHQRENKWPPPFRHWNKGRSNWEFKLKQEG